MYSSGLIRSAAEAGRCLRRRRNTPGAVAGAVVGGRAHPGGRGHAAARRRGRIAGVVISSGLMDQVQVVVDRRGVGTCAEGPLEIALRLRVAPLAVMEDAPVQGGVGQSRGEPQA